MKALGFAWGELQMNEGNEKGGGRTVVRSKGRRARVAAWIETRPWDRRDPFKAERETAGGNRLDWPFSVSAATNVSAHSAHIW